MLTTLSTEKLLMILVDQYWLLIKNIYKIYIYLYNYIILVIT